MKKTLECRDIFLFCDVHGHSRQKNLFLYGCQNQLKVLNEKKSHNITSHKERVFGLIFSKICDYFSFQDCNYQIQKCKESTGRVVVYREYGIVNSFTLECSFCGPNIGTYKDAHFNQRLLLVTHSIN